MIFVKVEKAVYNCILNCSLVEYLVVCIIMCMLKIAAISSHKRAIYKLSIGNVFSLLHKRIP